MAAELCPVEGPAAASGDWEAPQLTASQLHWLSRHIRALQEVSTSYACSVIAPQPLLARQASHVSAPDCMQVTFSNR